MDPAPLPIDDRRILIVVGGHLVAEAEDRPIAYGLATVLESEGVDALVCSDLWYLNDDHLRTQPTICIGDPGVNALTAFLADKVPSAFAIDDVLVVQLDLEFRELVACCWGADAGATQQSVDAFVERYLEGFIDAARLRWERS